MQRDISTNTLSMAVFSHTQEEHQSQAGFILWKMNTPKLITPVSTSTESLSLSRGTHMSCPDRLRCGGLGANTCQAVISSQHTITTSLPRNPLLQWNILLWASVWQKGTESVNWSAAVPKKTQTNVYSYSALSDCRAVDYSVLRPGDYKKQNPFVYLPSNIIWSRNS